MESKKQNKQTSKTKLIDTENMLVAIRVKGACGVGEMVEEGHLYGDRWS